MTKRRQQNGIALGLIKKTSLSNDKVRVRQITITMMKI